jgi:hypothetical protein
MLFVLKGAYQKRPVFLISKPIMPPMKISWLNGFHMRERFPEAGTLSRVVLLSLEKTCSPTLDRVAGERIIARRKLLSVVSYLVFYP